MGAAKVTESPLLQDVNMLLLLIVNTSILNIILIFYQFRCIKFVMFLKLGVLCGVVVEVCGNC